ncbi:MAG TPA: YIP1 family protein [Pirellulales bacterium]|nr:YIP1 family protein [Pirellulales bacterium]
MPSPAPFTEYWGPRTGPPWERDGASFASFMATLKQAYSSPQLLFREMRREGGLMAPLGFAFVGGMLAGLAACCYQLGFQALALIPNQPNGGAEVAAPLVVTLIVFLVGIPLGIIMQAFLLSAIFHLCLMIVGGANQPFETTYRVVNYGFGCATPLGLVPLCGPHIQMIFGLVLTGMGFAYAQETTGGKATFAVLIPVIVCCGSIIAMYAVLFAALIAGAR